MNKLYFYVSKSTDVYENISKECFLFENCNDAVCLYLWSNHQTVVIGKHQNAAKECNYKLLASEGGSLARRFTGGGAVYHDIHNLNFTFIAPDHRYDKAKHFEVMIDALKAFGINAEVSGRNDVVIDGRKFSGNAFMSKNGIKLHHGTIMINTDTNMMSRYLNVNKAKLISHGVESVRARVINLNEINPDITKEDVAAEMKKSFERIYGGESKILDESFFDKDYIDKKKALLQSDEHLFGFETYENSAEARFSWGTVEINYRVNKGVITALNIFTDALDTDMVEKAKEYFTGVKISEAGNTGIQIIDDIATLL